ncbi:carboxypeptidase-like regulatory domain-containing protein [Polaribacter sargassicola]|uniref:carboxypeptidase-like regulatory domain-containing protein n=1 Tax=Polaribacter sargassicola TaxID=2836891 RepID=UPI001F1ECACC|nr:carboxypeptidase-like regulatory domain-containing protein [Polaribacter sp. DS7-9]MCG1035148.1 carboxypeptidase-like regulatory domain-containing protein [Polaribacter sp. DS7-9]
MKNKLLFLLLFSVTTFCFSQKVTLSGSVKDSLQTPMPYANVIAKPKDVSKNLQFAITDNEGYYKLLLEKGDTITISISYLGYKPLNYQFIALKSAKKDFVLQQSSEQLDEVVIEMPVTVRGDTTTYKTDKFVNGTERKLKDVLKKLPGVEVDKNGGITVQGKKITPVLVDGKKFFGGNSKLAVENIPANAVGNVQVIDNYNEVAFLKGLTDSDETAMNIQLKEDRKRFVFGDIEAGKGNKEFYKTSANLFYYSPKTNVNFIGNINNIGEKTFTFRDYMSFSGGVNAIFSSNFNFKGGDFSQFMESRDLLSSKQKFGALNITKTATSTLDIAGYAIFSNTNTSSFVENQNEYTTFTEQKTNKTATDNLLGIGNLNIEYTPNNKEKWYARTQVKRTNNTNTNTVASLINANTNTIVTDRDLTATYINQNIEWHKRQNDKHTFSSVFNYVLDKSDKTNYWQTQDAILQGLIPADADQDLLRIHQLKNTQEQNIDVVFKHFWEINNSNHIYTTLGNKFLNEDFLSDDFQTLDNGTINNFSSDDFGNDLNLKLNDFFVGMHYKFRAGIFTLKQGVELHNYKWNLNKQTQLENNKWIVLPDFLAKIEFNKSKKITINYNLKTSFSDVEKLANRFYLQSYNSVFRGNEQLENNLYHAARIYYSRFSLYRGLMFFANFNYSKQIKGVRNTVDFNDVNQFLTVKMFDNPSEDIRGSMHLEKSIKNIKYKFDVGFNSSSYIQEIEAVLQTNKNNNYNYEVGFETMFDNFPTIEVGVSRDIGKFISSNSTSKFITTEPFVTVDYDFLKGFIFNFDYKRSNYQNKTLNQKNVYEIANTTLSYKNEDSAWSYKISVQNLFDAQFKQSNSFSDYLISDRKTFILPRIVMFSIGYNL